MPRNSAQLKTDPAVLPISIHSNKSTHSPLSSTLFQIMQILIRFCLNLANTFLGFLSLRSLCCTLREAQLLFIQKQTWLFLHVRAFSAERCGWFGCVRKMSQSGWVCAKGEFLRAWQLTPMQYFTSSWFFAFLLRSISKNELFLLNFGAYVTFAFTYSCFVCGKRVLISEVFYEGKCYKD